MLLLKLASTLRITRNQFVYLFLGLGIALSSGLAYAQASAGSAAADQSSIQGKPTATLVELPYTDGYGLLPKPPAFTKEESEKMFAEGKQACESKCVTSFGLPPISFSWPHR